MKIEKTTGIVLSSRVIGESDLAAHILTYTYGKNEFIFKGLKKSKKRSLAIADPGTFVELSYYFNKHKNLSIVNEFTITAVHDAIRSDFARILYLHFILETVLKTAGSHDHQPYLFKLTSKAIATLEITSYPLHLSLFFIIHLIKFNGILPDFTQCGSCHTRDLKLATFDFKNNHILCTHCAPKYNTSFTINMQGRTYILAALTHKFNDLQHNRLDADNAEKLLFYMTLFLEHYYHIQFKSKELIFLHPHI
jgi:DNA repair protein RecO (recombination protein O)